MSSHREAPSISQDPVADNADTYAFVSPDDPTTVTIITNYVPLEGPPGGPNFFEFGDDVLYSIFIDNDGDAFPDITYQFRFKTTLPERGHVPLQHRADRVADRPELEQAPALLRPRHPLAPQRNHERDGRGDLLGDNLACPPCNIGPRSTPDYDDLAAAAVHHIARDTTVFAGQRNDGFFVDLGAIFDLGDIRPIQNLHLIPTPAAPSVDPLKTLNIHTIAIKVPIWRLTKDGSVPSDPASAEAVLGIWGGASRRKVQVRDGNGTKLKERAVGAGLAPRQPALQRGDRAGRGQGPLERGRPERRQGLREVRQAAGAREAPAGPLSRRVPEPRRVHQGPGGPRGDPAHGHPERHRPRVPELHRAEAVGHAAAERRDPADHLEPERPRPGGRRRRRLPERAAGVRRRRLDRAEGGGGRDDSARRSELHARRRCRARSRRTSRREPIATSRTFPYLGTPHDGYDTPSS